MKKTFFALGSSLAVFFLAVAPALAYDGFGYWGGGFNGDSSDENVIEISNENDAVVTNVVTVIARTGDNVANGGDADGDAGDGGDVEDSGEDNQAGSGGDTGNAGDGGVIETGNAIATSEITNEVNYNCVEVEEEESAENNDNSNHRDGRFGRRIRNNSNSSENKTEVENENEAEIVNDVYVEALTNDNDANGGDSEGDAGEGGDVEDAEEGNEGGDGGSTGDAGWGGSISTGIADSLSRIINRINTNITRVR